MNLLLSKSAAPATPDFLPSSETLGLIQANVTKPCQLSDRNTGKSGYQSQKSMLISKKDG